MSVIGDVVSNLQDDLINEQKKRDEWVKRVKEYNDWINIADRNIRELTDVIALLKAREKNNGR